MTQECDQFMGIFVKLIQPTPHPSSYKLHFIQVTHINYTRTKFHQNQKKKWLLVIYKRFTANFKRLQRGHTWKTSYKCPRDRGVTTAQSSPPPCSFHVPLVLRQTSGWVGNIPKASSACGCSSCQMRQTPSSASTRASKVHSFVSWLLCT